uniref:Uncharacterized protein n=1 Tax=Nelumbo nucifera TaxID=4432 RepID=A0A822ZUA6_NELNU|nr:TPA_asm: hypothetical protein HUJ06_016862 [Nelumbo nucifera]
MRARACSCDRETSPPARQPTKNDNAGNPAMMGPVQARFHSDRTNIRDGLSQAHASLGSKQRLAAELQEGSSWREQCQVGSASVKTLMKVC